MAMTKEKIASMALIRLGAGPITSFTANTREAQVVSNMYDTVTTTLFSYANWNFATTKVALAQLSQTILDKNYDYVYQLPSSIVKVLGIFDANGNFREVKGKGVVGEQPVLEPGDEFEYTSGTPLNTTSGLMHGTYQMQNFSGKKFDVVIPPFSLDIPDREVKFN